MRTCYSSVCTLHCVLTTEAFEKGQGIQGVIINGNFKNEDETDHGLACRCSFKYIFDRLRQ
jgi:hypothetical protein